MFIPTKMSLVRWIFVDVPIYVCHNKKKNLKCTQVPCKLLNLKKKEEEKGGNKLLPRRQNWVGMSWKCARRWCTLMRAICLWQGVFLNALHPIHEANDAAERGFVWRNSKRSSRSEVTMNALHALALNYDLFLPPYLECSAGKTP